MFEKSIFLAHIDTQEEACPMLMRKKYLIFFYVHALFDVYFEIQGSKNIIPFILTISFTIIRKFLWKNINNSSQN